MNLKDLLQTALLCLVLQKTGLRSADVAFAQSLSDLRRDPILYYTTTELICSEGYPAQEHKVVTKDGYVLTVHRMPGGRIRNKVPHSTNHYRKIHLQHHHDFDDCINESKNLTGTGIPVLFVHGLLMASDGWLLQGPGNDLAYILADQGYDIWFVNVRGNFYSRKHISISPTEPRFWDFSFHENAVIDLPNTIDYILKVTKRDKIGYVGLSMGTTIFFTMTSTLPEYNDKILGFVGLAPVAFIKRVHMDHRRGMLFDWLLDLTRQLKKNGKVHELFAKSTDLVDFGKNYCSRRSLFQDFCYDLLSVFAGYHSKLVLRSKFTLYLTHFPTGTSLKTFIHYGQNINNNSFKMFDYGSDKNVQLYGSPTPPDYPLWNITAPVALYYSEDDFYYSGKDIDDLRKLLPNVVDVDVKHKFNHVDYLWSFNAKDILYPKALAFFKKLADQYYLQNRRKKSLTKRKT